MIKYLNVDKRIKTKLIDLIDEPVVVKVNKFDEDSTEKFSENISKAHETGQNIIPVVIDSYGGSVYSLMAMINEIQSAKLPIATIVESKAFSAAAVLFSFGHKNYRYMSPHATLMIHEVSNFSYGKNEEIKATAEETDRLNNLVFKLMAQNCNKPNDYFFNIIHEHKHADWYLTAEDAVKHNLTNHVYVPEFKVNVSVNYQFQ